VNTELLIKWLADSAKAVIAGAAVIAILGFSANSNLEAWVEKWDEEKIAREGRRLHAERAVIWSRRCERKGMDVVAMQADNEPWKIRCVPRRVLTVPGQP
jgi:hypothetical protein